MDALIAATCLARDLVLATRNPPILTGWVSRSTLPDQPVLDQGHRQPALGPEAIAARDLRRRCDRRSGGCRIAGRTSAWFHVDVENLRPETQVIADRGGAASSGRRARCARADAGCGRTPAHAPPRQDDELAVRVGQLAEEVERGPPRSRSRHARRARSCTGASTFCRIDDRQVGGHVEIGSGRHLLAEDELGIGRAPRRRQGR